MSLNPYCLLVLLAPGLAASARAQVWVTPVRGEHLIEGTVSDSATGRPVAGAYVWLIGERAGAVTDSAGHYAMDWSQSNGTHALVVRVCGQADAARGQAEFTPGGGTVRRDFVVPTSQPCEALPRPPWDIGPSDTTAVSGYLTYSWEGPRGGSVTTCNGEFFDPAWPPGTTLWDHQPEEGERQFVQLVGRKEDDPSMIPRPGFLLWGRPTFYIRQVLQRRPVEPADCSSE